MFPASAVVIHLRPIFKTISTSTAVVWPLASMFLASAVTTYLWPVFKTTTTSTAVVWPLASLSPASAVITYICILITTSTSSAVVWSLACSSSASAVNTFFAKMTLRTSTVHTNMCRYVRQQPLSQFVLFASILCYRMWTILQQWLITASPLAGAAEPRLAPLFRPPPELDSIQLHTSSFRRLLCLLWLTYPQPSYAFSLLSFTHCR